MEFEPRQFNYVFVVKVNNKKEALKQANVTKAAGIKDVWIQLIVE